MPQPYLPIFVEARPSEDCGCPEEEWIMCGAVVTLHIEEDGSGHIILDYGDTDFELYPTDATLRTMRLDAWNFVNRLS